MLLWVAVMPVLSQALVVCLLRTTPATRSAWMTSAVFKPVVRNVKPAMALAPTLVLARSSAAHAAVVVARVSVLPETARAPVLHRDRERLRSRRRRRLTHTSTLSGEQLSHTMTTFCAAANPLHSALAALENEGADDVTSPPSNPGSPAASKATPSIDQAASSTDA